MIKVGIIGASGYSGLELLKILLRHPMAEISFISGTSRVAGSRICDVFPALRGLLDIEVELTDIQKIKDSDVECIFLATPNETSLDIAPKLLENSNKKVIDLSGAFRLKDRTLYMNHYGFENEYDELLSEAVYGIPEFFGEEIYNCRLIANPGCYPTSIILPLVPLLKGNLIDTNTRIIIDSKSGVSGAGRKPSEITHYVEVNESFKAYNVYKHRHEPEIIQELQKCSSSTIKLSFTPHLLPITRGILSTIYCELKPNIDEQIVFSSLKKAFLGEKFVRILPIGQLPEVKHVSSTPFCDIGIAVRNEELVIVSCIDNLLKGASSQAVQNFNLMFGIKDGLGL